MIEFNFKDGSSVKLSMQNRTLDIEDGCFILREGCYPIYNDIFYAPLTSVKYISID